MKNIKIFLFNALLLFVANMACAEYNIEFKVNKYKNISDYDIAYFQDSKQIVKDIYKNNELTRREGTFPDGRINFINYYNIVVANVNIKNNKFDGLCTFFEINANDSDRNFNLNKRTEATYKDGILNGETTIFDENNRVLCILAYKDGKLNGESTYFNYENNFKKIIEFIDGIKKSEKVIEYKKNEAK